MSRARSIGPSSFPPDKEKYLFYELAQQAIENGWGMISNAYNLIKFSDNTSAQRGPPCTRGPPDL